MKQAKRILSLICTTALMLSLAACGSKETTAYSGQTLYGQVTENDDNNVTVQLGEWSETQGQPPEKPGGNGDNSQTPPNDAPSGGTPPDGQGGGAPGGNASMPSSYSAVNSYTEDTEVSGQTITSTASDENAVLVQNGANVTMKNLTLDRTSSDSTGGDSASFYGVGAGMLVTDGVLNVLNSTIHTDSAGGTGVFVYGGGTANVENTTIHTTQDTSGGIHVAGGGTLNAANLKVTTEGNSSAAIRSDRGGGTMTVNGGTYTSNGSGSPAVYCTANISVSDADLNANGSEAVCIEGLNSLKLTNCNLTGNMPQNSQNDCTWNVILYQSMSGDSQIGNSSFSMEGGTLAAKNGGVFYTTNTESTFHLSNVKINYAAQNDFFLKCTGNSNARGWGSKGSNGAVCTFTAENQEMQGDILWDSISKLDFNMSNGSVLTGAVLQDESNAGNGGSGYANVTIDESSKWIITGDSTVGKLTCSGTIQDEEGNTVSILNTDGTVIQQGKSKYHITVVSVEGISADKNQSVSDNSTNTNNGQNQTVTDSNNDRKQADKGTAKKKTVKKKRSKTVKKGKSVKVKVGKNAKILRISKKKIVSATLKGKEVVIKGKKVGKSIVTVKKGNTTYKINVKVKSQ